MMLTVMEPLSNQVDIVLVSHGVTAKHTRNFTHGDSTLPEIMLYQGHGYFNAFCTRLQRCYQDGVVFAFSSAFLVSPSHVNDTAIVSDGDDSDEEETDPTVPINPGTQHNGHDSSEEEGEWYSPPPPPSPLPLPPSIPTIPSPITSFELGLSLSFYDGMGQAETVVYEGVMPDGLTHTVQMQDGTRLNVHDTHLHLKMQADSTNIPRTPL